MNKLAIIAFTTLTAFSLTACGGSGASSAEDATEDTSTNTDVSEETDTSESSDDSETTNNEVISATVCTNGSDLSNIPNAYLIALEKYTTTNSEYSVYVCTEDSNGDGNADYMIIETTNQPEHESVYYDESHHHHEDFDFDTNAYKFDGIYDGSQTLHSAGNNMIEEQNIVMKMPINPTSATNKTATSFATIGLALNGVSFFNENAAPGDEITDELFTFDQCSGHPQQQGVYHYHVDPVCLIRDLGGNVTSEEKTVGSNTYEWIEDDGSNGVLLLGFLKDGFPVYGPIGTSETDCNGTSVDASSIDEYNGHSHCTAEFNSPIYHYHVKTAELGGSGNPVFWVTNEFFYGNPGEIIQ